MNYTPLHIVVQSFMKRHGFNCTQASQILGTNAPRIKNVISGLHSPNESTIIQMLNAIDKYEQHIITKHHTL